MRNKKRIELLEEKVKYLSETLTAFERIIKDYLKTHQENYVFDYLFSTEHPIEEIYCFIKCIDERISNLESKNTLKGEK